MKQKISRKLVLIYDPTGGHTQNMEMKFAGEVLEDLDHDIPGRLFPPGTREAIPFHDGFPQAKDLDEYYTHLEKTCDSLNKEIKKLVSDATFRIVEVKTIE